MFKEKGKRIAILLLVLIVAAIGLFSLVACDKQENTDEKQESTDEKTITIIIGNESYQASTDAEYLHDVLVQLAQDGTIIYEYDNGVHGAAIMKLNGLVTSSDWTSCVGIYHNIDDIAIRDMSEWATDFELNDITYYTSGVGVSSLPVVDGAMYLFKQLS